MDKLDILKIIKGALRKNYPTYNGTSYDEKGELVWKYKLWDLSWKKKTIKQAEENITEILNTEYKAFDGLQHPT